MMPRLSCSQRTTAPAMATDPCERTQAALLANIQSPLYLRCTFQQVAGREKKHTTAAAPPVRSRQACPGPVCRPRWSAGRGPTSPAAREAQAEAAENPESSGARGRETSGSLKRTKTVGLWLGGSKSWIWKFLNEPHPVVVLSRLWFRECFSGDFVQ